MALLSVMSNPIAIPPHHQSNRSVWIGTQQDTRKFIRKGFIKIHASPAQHSYAEIASPFAPLSSDFQASSKAPRPSPGYRRVLKRAQSSWSMVARYSAERPRRRCSGQERKYIRRTFVGVYCLWFLAIPTLDHAPQSILSLFIHSLSPLLS